MNIPLLEAEVQVGQHKYAIARMSVFEQMNIAADCRDILIGLAIIKRDRPKKMKDADYNKGVQFIITSRGGMTPEVRERVMNLCLSKIKRQSTIGWAPILAAEDTMQFNDIGLPEVVELLHATFEHNKLIDFFSEGPSSSGGQTTGNGQSSQMEKTG